MSSAVERSVRSWKSTCIHGNIVLKENSREHGKFRLDLTTSRYYQVPLALAVVPTLRLKIQWALINKTFISLNSHCTNIVLLISPTSFVNFANKKPKNIFGLVLSPSQVQWARRSKSGHCAPLTALYNIQCIFINNTHSILKNHLKDIRIYGYKDLRYCAPLTALYIYTHYTHCITQYIEKP